jgi:hypothetical protein
MEVARAGGSKNRFEDFRALCFFDPPIYFCRSREEGGAGEMRGELMDKTFRVDFGRKFEGGGGIGKPFFVGPGKEGARRAPDFERASCGGGELDEARVGIERKFVDKDEIVRVGVEKGKELEETESGVELDPSVEGARGFFFHFPFKKCIAEMEPRHLTLGLI